MKLPKELIKEIVKEEKFTSTNQIMETIKEMFSDLVIFSDDVQLSFLLWIPKPATIPNARAINKFTANLGLLSIRLTIIISANKAIKIAANASVVIL